MAVHLAAFALGAIMPVATALAAAEAEPFEIVICTVNGPVTLDARDLGVDIGDGEAPTKMPRSACALSLQAAAPVAVDKAPAPLIEPVEYLPADHAPVADTRPAYRAPQLRTSPPRAPPHTS